MYEERSCPMSNTLGEFIKKVRTEKGMSQEDLAKAAGMARSYVSRLEDNQFKSPSAMVLIRLAKGLGVSHDELFQAAGYLEQVEKDTLPGMGTYLRTKYPSLSEDAIKDIEMAKGYIEQKYKDYGKPEDNTK